MEAPDRNCEGGDGYRKGENCAKWTYLVGVYGIHSKRDHLDDT